MPKKTSPVRSKKFDHPKDLAGSFKPSREIKTPKHPKKEKGDGQPSGR
jgi:hypothetical protein